jgi:hypothetical protein
VTVAEDADVQVRHGLVLRHGGNFIAPTPAGKYAVANIREGIKRLGAVLKEFI